MNPYTKTAIRITDGAMIRTEMTRSAFGRRPPCRTARTAGAGATWAVVALGVIVPSAGRYAARQPGCGLPRDGAPRRSVTRRYLQTPASLHACCSVDWVLATSPLVTNNASASLYFVAQLSNAAAPWITLGTSALDFQSCAADCRYALNSDWLQSVRAQIEPFLGLKASCPSFEPATFSQFIALSRFLAPFGSEKLSESASKTPAFPGGAAQP